MDTKIVSSSIQCSNCFDRRYIFSSEHIVARAAICPSCDGHPPLALYPEGLDIKIIERWLRNDGFNDSKYASRIIGYEKSSIILKNKDEIERITSVNREILSKRERIIDLVDIINEAGFPSRYINFFDKNFKEVLDSKISHQVSEWLDKCLGSKRSLAFYGPNGTGKTLAAILTGLTFLQTYGKSVLFVSASEIFRLKKLISDTSIMEKSKNHHIQSYENFRKNLEMVDCLILDDLGSQSNSENNTAIYNDIVDMRYRSGKINIITTNHWKKLDESLDRQTLKTRIGARAADRVFESEAIAMIGESKRQSLRVISKEETEKFSTSKNPVDGDFCLSVIARNPFFSVISDSARSKLTTKDGDDIDIEPRTFNGVWHKEDRLKLYGPIAGINDQRVYIGLLNILTESHRDNNCGISFETTYSEILDKIGVSAKNENTHNQVRRSLNRLKRVSIDYTGYDGKYWMGGFIDQFHGDGKKRNHKLHISLNSSMVKFYNANSFFKVSLKLMREMNDFSQVLYLFSESHKDDHKLLPLEIFSQLCGRENGPDKDFRKKSSQAVNRLIELGVYTDQSKVEKNTIHIFRTPKLTPLSKSSPPPLQLS